MNFKTTIALLVLVIAVGTYFVMVESKQTTTTEREQAQAEKGKEKGSALFTADQIKPDDIGSYTIQRDGQTIQISRQGNDWVQTQPVKFALNSFSARSVLDEVATLRYTEKLTPGNKDVGNAESLGLVPQPMATLTLQPTDASKKPTVVKLGRKSIGGLGYVMVGEDKNVYVVSDALHKQVLDGKLNDWRKKTLPVPSEGEANQVVLTRNGATTTLIKSDTNWSFGPPESGRASADAIKTVLNNLRSTYVTKFVADDPKDLTVYGLDQPSVVLSVTVPSQVKTVTTQADAAAAQAEKPRVFTLRVGAPTDLKRDDFFATVSEGDEPGRVVFTLIRSDVERLSKASDDLRDSRLTPLPAAEVRELSIETSSGTVKLLREPTGWTFASGDKSPVPDFKADSGLVSDLVEELVGVKATSYRANFKSDAAPTATVTLAAIGRSEPDVLKIYRQVSSEKDAPATLFVLRNQETTGYGVEESKLSKLFAPAAALRDRNIVDVKPEQITGIILKRDGKELVFTREVPPTTQAANKSAASPWKMSGVEKFEEQAVRELATQLGNLHAEKWVTGDAKLGDRVCVVTVRSGDNKTFTVSIDPASKTAKLEGLNALFTVSDALAKSVEAEFRDRVVLSLPVSQIKQVDIAGIVISKNEDEKFVSSNNVPVEQSTAAALFDALAGLRVEKYIDPVIGIPGVPGLTIKITTTTDQTHTLTLAGATVSKDGVASKAVSLDGKWFVLDEITLNKLRANLFAKKPAAPTGMPAMPGMPGGLPGGMQLPPMED